MPCLPLRVATFLAPNLYPVYAFLTRAIGQKLGIPTELFVGTSYKQLVTEADAAFVCGLPYVKLTRKSDPPVEPLAAPVLRGPRYAGKPVYFSDVIVRRDSPFQSFDDLRGRSWAYNEPHSHSGFGVTRYHLARRGETLRFFGRVAAAGFHELSVRMVAAGEVDASAIDSQVLAVALRDHPDLAGRLRVLDSLGPSTIQPFVVARRLSRRLRADLRVAFLEIADDPAARAALAHGFIERFTAVDDGAYDDIRAMWALAEAVEKKQARGRHPPAGLPVFP